jgi:hypothetical protein
VGASATGTHGAPGAALHREVGASAVGTHGAPGAALCREVGAGATGTLGTFGAALSQEVGTGVRDKWRPCSYPVPGGGRRSHGDTWCPWSCPTLEPRGHVVPPELP